MIGVLFMFVLSLIGALLAMAGVPNFLEMDFVAWLTNLFGGEIIWPIAMVVGLVLVVPLVVLGAKKLTPTLETAVAKKRTSLSCVCYGLLVIPAVFLVRSIVIVGVGSISAFWVLFLFAALDAYVLTAVAKALVRSADRADREALDAANG
ncbi:MAG: hypothetical protein IJP02_02240 [Oscillospiraceae bacterium]|nr:hypothetical protein [Oscillospiraceae bacterium]